MKGSIIKDRGPNSIQPERSAYPDSEEDEMLWTIFVILLVLWALGLATSYTVGGFIHLLLLLAVVVVLIRVIQGRKILPN